MSKHNNQQLGKTGEILARKLLKQKRYKIIATNYKCELGEIDILALDGPIVVICEVKAKTDLQFGSAAEMITDRKKRQLKRLGHYIEQLYPDQQIRFDVVAIDFALDHPTPTYIKNAF